MSGWFFASAFVTSIFFRFRQTHREPIALKEKRQENKPKIVFFGGSCFIFFIIFFLKFNVIDDTNVESKMSSF